MSITRAIVALATTIFLASAAQAGPSVADVCQSGKLKATSSYAACRLKADAKAAIKSEAADYTKCVEKFTDKFPATEDKAGSGLCPSEGDVTDIQAFVNGCEGGLDDALGGDTLPALCGDGLVEKGESCDGSNLDGKTCASFGATDFVLGLQCTSGCTFDMTGCQYSTVPGRYRDNGDGTATDLWSGLMWEQKTGTPGAFVICDAPGTCPDPHDVNNDYRWTLAISDFDGTLRTKFLDTLNDVAGGGASCFAGYCDWRIPTVLELKGLLLEPEAVGTCGSSPCIDATFPGMTGVGGYWSASTFADNDTQAWYVRFDVGGGIVPAGKGANRYARAVRGGL
jgi:hypothetical protein